MADTLTIDVDATALLRMLDQLGRSAAAQHLKAAAKVTAERIATEAAARVARRTGKTAAGIKVEETRTGNGYVVFVRRPEMPGLPAWLEFGTKYMTARPFLFASARLEEGPHERRVAQALQEAIDEVQG